MGSSVFLAGPPINTTQFVPGSNTPASGALLFVYSVGTTSKTNSYTDPTASTARTNPIVLDSGGNLPDSREVWIASSAKFVLAPSNDTDPPSSPYWSIDQIPGINNITAGQVQSLSAQNEWVQGSTATFVGVTLFSLVGDQTALYTLGRRVKATVTGGDRFGIVTSSVLSANSTAVGVTLDSSTLNAGLSAVSYGILSTPNGSVPWTVETSTGANITGNSISTSVLTATTVGASTITAFSIVSSSFVSTGTLNATSNLAVGATPALTGDFRLSYGASVVYRDHSNSVNVTGINVTTVNGVNEMMTLAMGTRLGAVIQNRAPGVNDLAAGQWSLWRDTAASTTRFYYNNGGTMQSSAAFS
jgi:hypothetical protein